MSLFNNLVNHPQFPCRESSYVRWYPKSLTPITEDQYIRKSTLQARMLSGIYIHVPFCDELCLFCPFNKRSSNKEDISNFLQSLLLEINLYSHRAEKSNIEFIYFGGGTPSVLSHKQIDTILHSVHRSFNIDPLCEVTMEMHPRHLASNYASGLRNIGVNRISTGIQSFDDRILKTVGATHTSEEAWQAIRNANRDFGEVAIDLLFRCQGQSVSDFLSDIRRTIAIDHINHISLYSLVLSMEADQPSSLVEAEMTIEALNELKIAGFNHYASCATGGFDLIRERSHPCKYELRHWQAPQAEFLGLGPGALGFLGDSVTVNCLNIHRYNTELEHNFLPLVSITTGSHEELMRRYFVLGVKTLEVEFESFRRQFCVDPTKLFYNELEQLKKWNFVEIYDDRMKLTELGRLFVDTVSSQFFSSKEMGVNHPEEAEIRAAEKIIYRSHTIL